jgi:hypothetical protein
MLAIVTQNTWTAGTCREKSCPMDRALAVKLMATLRAAEANLSRLSAAGARAPDDLIARGLLRQIGNVMSSYVHMQMSIVRQFRDLDPDREDLNAVLGPAEADLEMVAALADQIGVGEERRDFREHIEKVSALYREIRDAVEPPG